MQPGKVSLGDGLFKHVRFLTLFAIAHIMTFFVYMLYLSAFIYNFYRAASKTAPLGAAALAPLNQALITSASADKNNCLAM